MIFVTENLFVETIHVFWICSSHEQNEYINKKNTYISTPKNISSINYT